MSFLIPALMAGAGGVSSLLGQSAGVAKKKRALQSYRDELDQSKYSTDDVANGIADVKAIGNGQIMSALNQIAPGVSGSLNETQAKGVMIAPYLSSQSQTIFNLKQKYEDYNKQVDQKKAQAALMDGENQIDYGDVAGSALGGAQIGMSLDSLYGDTKEISSKDLADKLIKEMPGAQASSMNYDDMLSSNPLLKKLLGVQ